MDEVTHTILEQPNGGLGSGFVGGIEMAGTLEPVSQQTQQEPDIDISMLG